MSRKATQKANRIASQKAAKRPHGESSGNALGLSARTLKVLDEMRAQREDPELAEQYNDQLDDFDCGKGELADLNCYA